MLNCKDVSKLVSESLDAELPLRKRIGVRMHLAMCGMCRAYRKQLLLLRRMLPFYARWIEEQDDGEHLSPETAERIKQELAERAKGESGKKAPDET